MDTDGAIKDVDYSGLEQRVVILCGRYGVSRAAIKRILEVDLALYGCSFELAGTGERIDPRRVTFEHDAIKVSTVLTDDYFHNDQSHAARRERKFARRTRTDGWEQFKHKDI